MESLLPAEWDALLDRMAKDNDLLDLVYKYDAVVCCLYACIIT